MKHKKWRRNGSAMALELWSMVDTMSPQYVFYWIAVGNKKLPIEKVVCKIEKVEWKKLYTKYKTLYIK
jgi:hypothetical protein